MVTKVKVKLTDVRGSFLDVIEAVQFKGAGKFYWGGAALVPVSSPQKAMIDKAIVEICAKEWGKNADKIREAALADPGKCCWRDGNKSEYQGYTDHWALSFKRYQEDGRPRLVDRDNSPILDPAGVVYPAKLGRIYSGAYYNVSVELWTQDNSYGKGIRCGLIGLQFVRDGDSFGGASVPSQDEFEDIADGAAAPDLV